MPRTMKGCPECGSPTCHKKSCSRRPSTAAARNGVVHPAPAPAPAKANGVEHLAPGIEREGGVTITNNTVAGLHLERYSVPQLLDIRTAIDAELRQRRDRARAEATAIERAVPDLDERAAP